MKTATQLVAANEAELLLKLQQAQASLETLTPYTEWLEAECLILLERAKYAEQALADTQAALERVRAGMLAK